MGQKLVVGPIPNGLSTYLEPFNIDNGSFPTLINAYQWRGRIKRKRGTTLLGRVGRWIGTTNGSGNLTVTIVPSPIPVGSVSFTVGTDIFTDPGGADPVTLITNSTGTAVLTRSTGVLVITGSIINTAVVYYPSLPIMGLETLQVSPNVDPGNLAFDTTYAYNINTTAPYPINDVSYYKNPLSSGTYVQKTTWTPVTWNGLDYQQFWTVNYEGALWTTNGVHVPFNINNIGMQYAPPASITSTVWVNATTMQFTITGNVLVIGDFVFVNEFSSVTPTNANTLNFQTGYVTNVVGSTITVTFPNATIANDTYTPGIIQYLTNRSDVTRDCIRWYDGDPTNSLIPPTFTPGKGWVNFMPPLSEFAFNIAGLKAAQYYLVGAKMIIPFKDRLLFIGPVVQTATAGSQVYLQDTVIWSQNGTPYYTASFTLVAGDILNTAIVFNPLLTPTSNGSAQVPQGASPTAWWEDQTGFGGFISAGVSDPINTASPNEDVLILGFSSFQARFVNTNDDITPFNFFIINSELGSSSTFSFINMDEGIISRGSRGYVMTSQTNAVRIDIEIPDQVFEINLQNNGNERFTAQRDFINEWIYLTYNSSSSDLRYPNQTLQYNYREQTYAIFNESYTTYGQFKVGGGYTWATLPYQSWDAWTTPWNAGDSQPGNPLVIAGNSQGYIVFRAQGVGEATTLYIQNIVGITVTSPNHNLSENDYIVISGVLGTVGPQVNGNIFQVFNTTSTTFMLNPTFVTGTYLGGGVITKMYNPFIQTKQFPVFWGMVQKTRIGPQQYLFSKTDNGQVTVLIYLSQDDSNPYNAGPIVPSLSTINSSLIYSQIVYTCPESTNLGLTPANINLNQVTASSQIQIWHRMNTSLIGDTIQLGFTFSDAQMRDINFNQQFDEFELHGFIIDVNPSMMLA